MTARTQIGTVWGVGTQTGSSTSLVAPAHTITAGSLVRCIVRGESSDATATATDSAGGTWTFVKARDSNVTVWLGYSWNHPGGTNVVVTVSFTVSQSYRSCTFVEHSGGDASDPYQSGSLASSAGSGAMNLSVPFTGDVSVFAGQGNYSSTSYTAVNGVLLQTTNYHACLIINSTSSSPANPRLTGSSGGVATIAAAFSDPAAAADTTPPTLSSATLTSTSATTSTGGITTDEAGPAWAVATTSATQPSDAQVKAGHDHLDATAPSDTATLAIGANPAVFSFTGQTTGATYYLHVLQDDEADTPNTSDVESSAGEVIAAPTTVTVNTLVFTEGDNARMRMALAAGLRTGGCTLIWREKRLAQTDYSGGFVFSDGSGSWDSGAWTALFVTHGCDGTYDSTGQRTTGASTPMYHEIAGLDSAAFGSANDYIASNSSLGTQASYPAQYGVWVERSATINPNGSVLEHVDYVDFTDPTKGIKQNIATSDPVTPTNQYLDFGAPHWITNGSEDFSGEITHIKVFSRALSESEIRQEFDNFSDTPVVSDCWYSNYSPTAASLTDKKPSGTAHPFVWNNGTATDSTAEFDLAMAVASATHAHSADSPVLTTDSTMAVDNSTHGHSAENLTLSTVAGTDLVVSDAAHDHAAESPTLTTDSTVVVADVSHAHAAGAVVLTTDSTLAVENSVNGHTADNLTLSTVAGTDLVVSDVSHVHAAEAPALTTDSTLSVDNSAHAHSAASPAISVDLLLTVASASHAHTAGNVTLSTAPSLEVQDSDHSHAAESPALTIEAWLGVADAWHVQTSESPVLSFDVPLTDAEIRAEFSDIWLAIGELQAKCASRGVVLIRRR